MKTLHNLGHAFERMRDEQAVQALCDWLAGPQQQRGIAEVFAGVPPNFDQQVPPIDGHRYEIARLIASELLTMKPNLRYAEMKPPVRREIAEAALDCGWKMYRPADEAE